MSNLLAGTLANGSFLAKSSVAETDIYLIAVPTPLLDHSDPDLHFVEQAVRMISSHLKKGDLVILESTSPVGTTDSIIEMMSSIRLDLKFPNTDCNPDVNVAYCPERILPGNALKEQKTTLA